jgi:hypothetical protein
MRSSLTISAIKRGCRSAPARFGRNPPRRSDELPSLALQRRLARTAARPWRQVLRAHQRAPDQQRLPSRRERVGLLFQQLQATWPRRARCAGDPRGARRQGRRSPPRSAPAERCVRPGGRTVMSCLTGWYAPRPALGPTTRTNALRARKAGRGCEPNLWALRGAHPRRFVRTPRASIPSVPGPARFCLPLGLLCPYLY